MKFSTIALDKNVLIFVIHISTFLAIFIYISRNTQIRAFLAIIAIKTLLVEYLNYIDIFSTDLAMEFPEKIKINDYTINLLKRNHFFIALSIG